MKKNWFKAAGFTDGQPIASPRGVIQPITGEQLMPFLQQQIQQNAAELARMAAMDSKMGKHTNVAQWFDRMIQMAAQQKMTEKQPVH